MRSTTLSRLKFALTSLLFVLTLSLLTACGGNNSNTGSSGNNGGSNSGGSTPGGSNPGGSGGTGGSGGGSQSAASFVYVSNNGPKQLQAFSFNGTAFTQIQGSPYAIGSFAPSIVIADSTLIANAENGSKTWTIDPNSGALTPGPGSPAGVLASYGNTAYGASSQGITAYSVSNGTVTQIGSPVSIANLCFECTGYPIQVSSDGKYVFVMLSGFHDVNGFAVLNRASDGSISNARFVSGVNGTTSAAAAVVVSKDSRYIYEFNQSGTIQLWQFDPASAKATQVTFTAASPTGIADSAKISPDGKFLIGVFAGVNRIDVFAINSTSGALTPVPGSPFATGTNPTRLAFSSDGQTLFVDCRGDGSADLFAYHIGADGSLTQVAHQSLGGDPSSIAVK